MKLLPLSIDKAGELYLLIKKHVPKETTLQTLEFVGKIVHSMAESDPLAYSKCLELITGSPFQKLICENNRDKILVLFIEGLKVNRITFLCRFFERMGL